MALQGPARVRGRLATALVVAEEALHDQVLPLLALAASRVATVPDVPTLQERLWDITCELVVIEAAESFEEVSAACVQLRLFFQQPIMIIAAGASEAERIAWLDAGADDVLPQRGSLADLPARCGALLRRVQRQRARDPAAFFLHALGMRLDVTGRRLFLRSGDQVGLSGAQTRFLAPLFANEGAGASVDVMGRHMFGAESSNVHRRLAYIIRDLERRFARLPHPVPEIRYRRGAGYSLALRA
jgi:DNA-binding response OmpR family regulator